MDVSSMIVDVKTRSLTWVGLVAQAWTKFFCEKHFAKEASKRSLTHVKKVKLAVFCVK